MKGYKKYRTKPQDLTEIAIKQEGFLSGLNADSPKSDVGSTQLTALENAITFRDRVEARGGLKPTTKWKTDAAHDECLFTTDTTSKYYDKDWDEIFFFDGEVKVTGTKPITGELGVGTTIIGSNHVKFIRVVDKILVCVQSTTFLNYIIEDRGSDYFMRTLTGIDDPNIEAASYYDIAIQLAYITPGTFVYSWRFSWLRIVDGIVVAESSASDIEQKSTKITKSSIEPDGGVSPFSITAPSTFGGTLPLNYVFGDPDNYYTHIRIYRTKNIENYNPSTFDMTDQTHYKLVDYELDYYSALVSGSVPIGLNGSDSALDIKTPLWQDGYATMPTNTVAEESNAMLLIKREGSEIDYCPIAPGDNQKYIGRYNPFFQFSKGVNGEVTMIKDLGDSCLITTKDKSYRIDTGNKYEDEDQQALAIYTPFLSDVAILNKNMGVNLNQRLATVDGAEGKLISLTSDGAIREFSGFSWGVNLSKDKVNSITNGIIKENSYSCTGAYSDDAYYLTYVIEDFIEAKQYTIRMGNTEEAGLGFSVFTGENNASGWPYHSTPSTANINGDYNNHIVINDVLYVVRKNIPSTETWLPLMEYTGDKFDKKINKDVIDEFDASAILTGTTYYPIGIEMEFPEMTPSSESYFLYYLKSNYYLRADRFAYKVTDEENTAGWEITDSNIELASLNDVEFGMDARIGESETIVASNNGFEPTSAVVLQREVQDHRIRLTLRGSTAGFQLTGMEAHFKRHNRTELSSTTTTSNTTELNTGLYCLINQHLANYAVGSGRSSMFDMGVPIEGGFILPSNAPQVVGTAATIVTGPDGTNTGISLQAGASYEWEAPQATGNPTIMFWEKDFSGRVVAGWTSSEADKVQIDGASTSVWVHTAYVYNGTGWDYYVDGILVLTSVESLPAGATNPSILIEGEGLVADVRMYNKNLTAEQILFYYNNVIDNEGDYVNGY
jgi:hypothetical protein